MLFHRKAKLDLRRCLVPESEFKMGSEGQSFDESPMHRLYVSAFEMALTPVTVRDYGIYLKQSTADAPPWWDKDGFDEPDQPVVGVNWNEANRFCEWLSESSGFKIRLPSEAEFEKAARGGQRGYRYPWGDNPGASGLRPLEGPLPAPMPVGRCAANGYGLYDMVANVLQWCVDGYDPEYYAESPERNPISPGNTGQRVARGASWKDKALVGRCAARSRLAPYFRCDDYGFRWVRTF